MSKIKIEICEICGKEECDGKEYKTEYMWGSHGLDCGIEKVCRNHPDVEEIDGRLMYKLVSGHGDYQHYYIFPVEYSDERVEEEAKKLKVEDEIKEKKEEEARAKILKEQRRKKYEELKKEFKGEK